jgi:hypothetical protein
MATVTIKDIYNEVFGIKPKYLIPRRGGMDLVPDKDYLEIEVFPEDEDSSSQFGTPILEKIILKGGNYKTFEIKDGVPVVKQVSYAAYEFEGWPMIDVSQDKVIVTTPINGRDGTVKEYIYTDDHQVTIRGLLIGDGNAYPYDARRNLTNMFKINNAYAVESRLLNEMGVLSLVIKSIQFNELEGYNNVCPFTITCISDRDVLLTIKDKRKI